MTDSISKHTSFTQDLPQLDDFRKLFLKRIPMLDVRAPIEYEQGAFPTSINLPLMNNAEREAVGIKYKDMGQDEAITLGHQLVSGDVKEQRVQQWVKFFEDNPDGLLYCFRGGMRSKITQQWIYDATGKIFPRVKGGYKAMRRFLINELERSTEMIKPIMLGGRTGIGKTECLQEVRQTIDLEGLYHHRGSVFGKHADPQPSQIDIENTLSIKLMELRHLGFEYLLFEDEAANIGSRRIPEVLFDKFKQSPLILLQASVEERVDITFREYIVEALKEHQHFHGEDEGWQSWADYLHFCFDKIQRRLGGVRYQQLKDLLGRALEAHRVRGDTSLHREWIERLLVDYYDPMYDYQISKKTDRVVFQGNRADVLAYLSTEYQLR